MKVYSYMIGTDAEISFYQWAQSERLECLIPVPECELTPTGKPRTPVYATPHLSRVFTQLDFRKFMSRAMDLVDPERQPITSRTPLIFIPG